ncbi:MAG: site-specific integrase [Bacteroidales bacterium]|nr:site-specific integrase [Bacteroidales bacterium]
MKKKPTGVMEYFRRHNDEFAWKVGLSRVRGTYDRYRIVCGHLGSYIRQRYRRDDIPLVKADASFVGGFDSWLRTGRHLAPNSVWGYMIVVKHIFALARGEGLMKVDPFASYVNSYTGVDRGYLTEDELVRLMDVPVRTRVEEQVRDLFLFAAFTGLSYVDVKNLREDNVRRFFDGNWWIIVRRHKTGVESNVRLLDVPLRLVEKYRGTQPDGRLFPVPSNNCCNENLQHLAARCGIGKHLTFHVGRHTFATLALNRGMPVETLSRILGHTNIRTTQIYAKITDKKVSADMAALADSLSGVEGDIRRSLNLVPSESAARPCAATDTVDTQLFIKSDPLGLRGGQPV